MSAMTQSELQAIRDRLAKATPGPWSIGKPHDCDNPRCRQMVHATTCGWNIWQESTGCDVTDPRANLGLDDALFIAHARTDVERLLAEVERLQGHCECCDYRDDSEPPVLHWVHGGEVTGQTRVFACGADGIGNHDHDLVTCETCLALKGATREHCPLRLAGVPQEPHQPCDAGDFTRDGGSED